VLQQVVAIKGDPTDNSNNLCFLTSDEKPLRHQLVCTLDVDLLLRAMDGSKGV
jgi:hypothetical protein